MKYEPETRNDGNWVRIEDYNELVTRIVKLREALNESRQPHYSCEDSYYNCGKHEDAWRKDDECSCGADAWNAKIDRILKETA